MDSTPLVYLVFLKGLLIRSQNTLQSTMQINAIFFIHRYFSCLHSSPQALNFKICAIENNFEKLRYMIKISPAINDANNKLFVGFAGYASIHCEICFEPFHTRKRPLKLLPCEHNFCEQCIFSLRCHQQVMFWTISF